jgi:hypothetical protein
MWSNGNSFSNGQSADATSKTRYLEPWLTSGLLRPWQARGNT